MACLWCIKSQLSKRLNTAFNKWRLNALIIRLSQPQQPAKSDSKILYSLSNESFGGEQFPISTSHRSGESRPTERYPKGLESKAAKSDSHYVRSNDPPVTDRTNAMQTEGVQSQLVRLEGKEDPEERRKILRTCHLI